MTADKEPQCTFEARYDITNTGTDRREVTGIFYTREASDVVVTLAGARVPLVGGAAAQAAEDQIFDRPWYSNGRSPDAAPILVFTADLAPGESRELLARGRTAGISLERGHRFLELPARTARHLKLGAPQPIAEFRFVYEPSGKLDTVSLRLRFPARWHFDDADLRKNASAKIVSRPEGDWTICEIEVPENTLAEDGVPLSFDVPPPRVMNGGPLIALGGELGDAAGIRARLGYELAASDALLFGASADTSFYDHFVIAPHVTLASPLSFILPSLGITAGVPVQLYPDVRVGGRIQGDIMFGPFGFVTSIDLYPKAGSLPARAGLSLLGQISF